MSIAAVPEYLGRDFSEASPGMRFGMYLVTWKNNWEKEKNPDWSSICRIDNEHQMIASLQDRQSILIQTKNRDSVLSLPAVSTAPFVTGMGNEHPQENGFAFLWPYGIPYLPGSGVKGVLRQAARELAGVSKQAQWAIESEWDQSAITALFGSEDSNDARRGTLSFWDVIPKIQEEELLVEIMTPHQSHYYQKGEQPHDSGMPTPIQFLTVPPGSGFNFHLVCDLPRLQRLAPELARDGKWKALIKEAFDHAFDWLGFGAKTAVGYGAVRRMTKEEIQQQLDEENAAKLRCPWVDEVIARIVEKTNAKEDEVLRGKLLAQEWQELEDEAFKQQALKDIRARWEKNGWWDAPPGKAAKKAKKIYEGDSS